MERDCNTCMYKSSEGCLAWDCEYISTADALKAYKLTRWIPTTDRLPGKTGAYLVTCQNGNVKVGHFTSFSNEWTDAKATAWMPLPKAYEEV